jgi:SAM-dependent methyltransferase
MVAPEVLEIGTRRWESNRPTHHQEWVPDTARYVMSDFMDGLDVDVVADAHTLEPFDDHSFDAFVAVSVWEHLERPWVAAQQVARVLRPGGIALIATHQTFPIHGYPSDYFRFSDRALALLFTDAGMETVVSTHLYPCRIIPPPEVTRWNAAAPAFLNVEGVWRLPPADSA